MLILSQIGPRKTQHGSRRSLGQPKHLLAKLDHVNALVNLNDVEALVKCSSL